LIEINAPAHCAINLRSILVSKEGRDHEDGFNIKRFDVVHHSTRASFQHSLDVGTDLDGPQGILDQLMKAVTIQEIRVHFSLFRESVLLDLSQSNEIVVTCKFTAKYQ